MMSQAGLNFEFVRRVPVILQSEMAECGLACLAMISSYFGRVVDIRTLRSRFGISLKGLGLTHLLSMAEKSGLNSRAVRCEPSELKDLKLPAVLHWDFNHYVVLVKVRGRHCWLHDPALGKRKLSLGECGKRFTGVAVELNPSLEFEASNDSQDLPVSTFWKSTRHLGRGLMVLLGLSLLIQVTALAGPYYMQWVIDEALLTSDHDLLFVLASGFILVMLFGVLLSSLRSWFVLRLSSVFNLNLGVGLLGHMLRLPLEFFEKRHIGDIVSRFSSLGQVRERITTGVVETLVDGVMAVLMLVVMLLYSVKLTAVVLFAVVLYVVVRSLSYGPLYRLNEQAVQAAAVEQTNFLETVRSIQCLKLFGQENQRLGLWQNHYTEVINSDIRLGKFNIGFTFSSSLIFGLENVLVIYFAAQDVLAGYMTVGMMLAFMAYKGQLSGRLTNLVEQWIAFRMLRLHLNRLADIALSEPESSSAAQVNRLNHEPSSLCLENVSFSYGQNEEPLFTRVNLTAPAGAFVAIVGPSGGGKSTLLKLMAGLLMPIEGRVSRDGTNIKQIGYAEYRKENSAVMQDDQLLSGSVADNICFFDLQSDPERMVSCAQIAAIHEDIARLPMGYESLMGDMGSQFSGGQIQRVLLARALYQQPRILFLDEATCHLDVDNETHVARTVAQLPMTRVVVAHKLEIVQSADLIVLLEKGLVTVFKPEDYFAQRQENWSPTDDVL